MSKTLSPYCTFSAFDTPPGLMAVGLDTGDSVSNVTEV